MVLKRYLKLALSEQAGNMLFSLNTTFQVFPVQIAGKDLR